MDPTLFLELGWTISCLVRRLGSSHVFFVWLKCWVRWNEIHTRGASMSSSDLSSLLGYSLSPPMRMHNIPPSHVCPMDAAPLASEGVRHRSPGRRGCRHCSPCSRVDADAKVAPRSLAPLSTDNPPSMPARPPAHLPLRPQCHYFHTRKAAGADPPCRHCSRCRRRSLCMHCS